MLPVQNPDTDVVQTEAQSQIEVIVGPHTHTEIKHFLDTNFHEERLDAYRAKFREAFDLNGQHGQRLSLESMGKVHEITDSTTGNIFNRESLGPREFNQPQIVFREVEKRVDARSLKQKFIDTITRTTSRDAHSGRLKTGQVFVAINLNNGDSPDNNTVMEALVYMDENGNIDLGEATFSLTTEEKFTHYFDIETDEQIGGPRYVNASAAARMARGKLTRAEFRKAFKEENGRSISQLSTRRDRALKRHSERIMPEEEKEEFFEHCANAYESQQTRLQQATAQVVAEVDPLLREVEAQHAALFESEELMALVISNLGSLDEGTRKNLVLNSLANMAQVSGVTSEKAAAFARSVATRQRGEEDYAIFSDIAKPYILVDGQFEQLRELVALLADEPEERSNPIKIDKYKDLLEELAKKYSVFGMTPKIIEAILTTAVGYENMARTKLGYETTN